MWLPVMGKGMAGAEGLPDMHELWIKLNRPSAERFRQALVKRGMVAPSVKHIRELFLKYQSSKQLFAHRQNTQGMCTQHIWIHVGRPMSCCIHSLVNSKVKNGLQH